MHQTGGEFLAAAGFTGDIDRRLTARQLLDQRPDLFHCRRLTDQGVQRVIRGFAVRHAQRRLDQGAQLFEADRLGQIVEGAGLQRGNGIFGTAVGGDHRHRHVRMLLRYVTNDFEAIAVRQAHVGQAKLEVALGEACPGLGTRTRASGRQPHARQRQVDQLTDIRLVIDDQHAAQCAAWAPVASGN